MKRVAISGLFSLVFLLLCVGLSEQQTCSRIRRSVTDDQANDTTTEMTDEDDDKGLYYPTDHVFILNATNFEASVINNPNKTWVVEWYANWCIHSQNFVETWKSLGKSVYKWRDVVVIAAFDCGPAANKEVCRAYGIKGVPSVRTYPPNSPSGFHGDEFELGEDNEIDEPEQRVIAVVQESVSDGNAGVHWPNLNVTGNLSQALSELPPETKYVAVMFETSESFAGPELILDFNGVNELTALRVLDSNEEYVTKYNVTDFPSLYVQQRGSSKLTLLSVESETRKDFFDALKTFLAKQGIQIKSD